MRWIALLVAMGAVASASAQCPGLHLEPTLDYGRTYDYSQATVMAAIPFGEDDDLVFQYFEYYSKDPGFAKVFGVHVLLDVNTRKGRVFLSRIKDGKPVLQQASLGRKSVELATALASPIVYATRYPSPPCRIEILDGYVMQVAAKSELTHGRLVGGESNSPAPGTPAHQLQVLGRALRAITLGELAEARLESALQSNHVAKP